MRNLVFDFEVTILWPLILVSIVVLWSSIRTYRWPSDEWWERPNLDEHEKYAEWEQRRREEKRKAQEVAWFSVAALVVTCAVMLFRDGWKTQVAYLAWKGLEFISFISFIITFFMAWHYARKVDRLRLGICMLAMLLAAASTEHFFHQTINAGHIACPHCSDHDEDTSQDM